MKRYIGRVLSVAALAALCAATAMVCPLVKANENETPSIKEIMKVAHKGDKNAGTDPLCKLIVTGKGTHENAEELLKLYKALAAAMPPKGDQADWKMRTEALVAAAEELKEGEKPGKKAIATYKKALDCKGCHTEHKPA